jgi:hypothetical protein
MRRLYARIALGALRRRGDELPDRELVREGVEIDRGHLAAYDRVCGFRLRDELPSTYPHVLAFPLALELMADPAFPFSPLGLVHVGNRIEQTRPLRAGERIDLRVRAADLGPHDRGTRSRCAPRRPSAATWCGATAARTCTASGAGPGVAATCRQSRRRRAPCGR